MAAHDILPGKFLQMYRVPLSKWRTIWACRKSGGECSCGRLSLVPNSHLWLLEVGFFPAATPRATVTTSGLNQVRVSGVVCASTPGMSDSRTSHLPTLKMSYGGGDSNLVGGPD
ncbi:unnamed protein product [Schistocephalus solidus]|uniref:Uncharacterized protein n=1 Tax=Schistocephalus solidus TaxID=70667 RepID=A0A183TS09_SCHSO|nr:unnamed protein product [Schistocephalus solidus]